MSSQRKGNKIVAVMNGKCEEIKELVDYVVEFDIDGKFDNILLGFDYIILAQTVAVLKSLAMGKTPDNPCPTGEVNRVVKGVTLYPYSKGE